MCIRDSVRVDEGAYGCKSHVQCDALILDEDSESRTFPYMDCLLYTSDAADERSSVDLGGRRIIKKNKESTNRAPV